MNEKYLRDLHKHLGITDDFDTWVNAIQGNTEYLTGLHGHLGIQDDFNTWNAAVFSGAQVQEEVEVEAEVPVAEKAGTIDFSRLKKKEDTESVSGNGSSASPKDPYEEQLTSFLKIQDPEKKKKQISDIAFADEREKQKKVLESLPTEDKERLNLLYKKSQGDEETLLELTQYPPDISNLTKEEAKEEYAKIFKTKENEFDNLQKTKGGVVRKELTKPTINKPQAEYDPSLFKYNNDIIAAIQKGGSETKLLNYTRSIDEAKELNAQLIELEKQAESTFTSPLDRKSLTDKSLEVNKIARLRSDIVARLKIAQAIEREYTIDPELGAQDVIDYFPDIVDDVVDREFLAGKGSASGAVEENVVSKGNSGLDQYGFTFEEVDTFGDGMMVRSANGKSIYINLNYDATSQEAYDNSEKLQNFLNANRRESEIQYLKDATLTKGQRGVLRKEKKLLKKEDVDNELKIFQDRTKVFNNKLKDLLKEEAVFSNKADDLLKKFKSQGQTPELLKERDILMEEEKTLRLKRKDLNEEGNLFENEGKDLDKMAGEYYRADADNGTFLGTTASHIKEGVGSIAADAVYLGLTIPYLVDKGINFIGGGNFHILPTNMIVDNYSEKFKDKAEEMGFADPSSMSEDDIEKVNDALRENALQTRLYGEEEDANPFSQYTNAELSGRQGGILNDIREGVRNAYGEMSSRGYDEEFTKTFWGQVWAGTMSSIPAILTMVGSAPAAVVKEGTKELAKKGIKETFKKGTKAVTGAINPKRQWAMIMQTQDMLNQEMNANPELKNVPEEEKFVLGAILGLTTGVLEDIGLRNMINNKGFVNGLILKGLGKSGATSSAKTFQQIIREDVNNMVARLGLTAGAGFAAEFETGVAQEIANIGVKEVYDAVKGKDYFKDNPKTAADFINQTLYAGVSEGAGSLILGLPNTLSSLKRSKNFTEVNDVTWNLFTNTKDNPKFLSMQKLRLESQVKAGDITASEARNVFKEYQDIIQAFEQVPKNLKRKEQQEALGLIINRKQLEERKRDKNPLLTKQEDAAIAEIDRRLAAIGEVSEKRFKNKQDAIQKQSTGEVDADQQAADAQTVETGESTTESQELTGEELQDQEADAVEGVTQEQAETVTTPVAEEVDVVEQQKEISRRAKQQAIEKYKDKSVEELELRQGEIEDSKNQIEKDEFNQIERALEQREWDSVVNTSLDNTIENLKNLKEKEKNMPFGFGAYAELSELSAAQSVAEKYKNKNVSRDEALADFREAFILGGPAASYVDAIMARESASILLGDNYSGKDLMELFILEYTSDGFSREEAKSVFDFKREKLSEKNKQSEVTEEAPTTQEADEITAEDAEGQAAVEQAAIEEQMDLQELMELAENTLEIEIPKKQKIAILQQELESLKELKEILEQSPEYQIAELMPKILPESARAEAGGKVGTKQDISIGLTSKKGVTVERAAGELVSTLKDALGYDHGLDQQSIRNIIIDVLKTGKKPYQQEILGDVNESIRETKQEISATKKGPKLRKKTEPSIKRQLAPNGQPSNLNPEQYKLVRTPAFKKWFGDWETDPENASKVVDENGEPLVVYHGSNVPDIEIFDRSKSKRESSGLKAFGIYFSTNPTLAEVYAKTPKTEEYQKEVDKKIEVLKERLNNVRNNRDYDLVREEIDVLENKGRIYPVFLNIRDMVTFDGKNESFISSWSNLKVDVEYKIAKGFDALEFLSPKINKEQGLDRFVEPVNGIKAENIVELDYKVDKIIDGKLRSISPTYFDDEIRNSKDYKEFSEKYGGDAYLLFDGQPQDIKLADGSNVTFDPQQPSIKLRKKRKGQTVEVGIQEEIDNVIEILQKSFPSVTVSQTQEAFNEALKEEGVRRHQSGDTTILGITKDGKIILNPNNQSMATAIHEFGHVWIDYLRSEESGTKGTVLLNRGMKLMDDPANPYYQEALKEYGEYDSDGNLTNKDLVLEEALVEAMANKGESYVKAAKKSKFISWLKSLFKFVKAKLTRSKDLDVNKIKDLSLDEFIDVGIADLFSGKEASIKFDPTTNKKEARARAIKNGEKFVREARARGKKDAQIAQVLKTFGLEQKDIDSLLGVKKEKKTTVKKPPSAAKILGKPKPKRVTANEMTLLKEKLRAIARETKNLVREINKVRKGLQVGIAEIGKGRKVELSPAIVTKITSRINKANLLTKEKTLNNEMIDEIVQYIDEQYTTLERKKENVALNKKRKTALKNIMSGKLGVPKVITRQMQRLFAADSILIPNSSLNKYKALVESIGERTSVLTVDEVSQVERQVDSILKDLDLRTSQIDIYAEMYKDYDKKVKNADGNISYSKTIDKMVDDAELNLSTEDAALMKKFKKEILPPPEPKTKEEKQKEEEEAAIEKELFLEEIGELSIKSDKLTTRDERKVANKLNKLIKTDGVKDLSNNDLKKLIKIIDNINNGWLPHLSQIMVEKINSNNRSKIVSSALRAAKVFSPLQQAKKLRALLNSQLSPEGRRKNKIYQAVSVRSLSYIDSVIGLKGREIFKNIFDSTAKAFTNFDSDNNKVNKRIDEALNKISSVFSVGRLSLVEKSNNKIHEAKARIMTYLIQREFESNPERVGEVNPAIDYLNDTIKYERKQGNDGEADMLQNIIDKYSIEGEISLDKIYKSFNKAELNGIKVIDEVNKELTDTAEFTAGVVRGKIISPIVDYIHMWVKQDNTKQQFEDKNSDFNSYMKGTKPSTKAKNLEERTKGSKAINFDPFGATRRGARMTLLDYHMTPVVRETNRTLRKTEDILEGDNKQTREVFRGVKAAYDQVVEDVIGRGFNSNSVGDNVIKYIAKTGYRTMLASPARMTLEFTTNLLNAGIINPLGFAKGFSVMSKLSGQEQAELLRILESKQQTRLYSDALKGRMVDTSIIESKTGIKNTKLKGEVINRASQIGSHLRKYPSGIEFIADTMITTPDKAVMRPLWLGTFSREFKKITGKEIDMDKVLAKDEAYLNKNQEALDKATEVADRDSIFSGYTDNPFMKVISGTKRADDGAIKKMYKDYNRFMLSFLLNEYETTRQSIRVLYEGGEISRIKAGQLLAATTSRMVLYTSLIGLVGNVFADFIRSMFGVDMEDEEEEKDLTLSIGQGLVSTFNTLAFGASYGQLMRSIINNPYIGTEYFNEKYLTALQEGEYDPYKDAIGFSAFTKPTGQEKYKGKDPFKFFVNFLGPYSPLAKTAAKGYTMLTREEEAKKEETKARRSQEGMLLMMQGLGHFNLIPFFKDVNKAYTREVYKDFRKAEKETKKTSREKRAEKYLKKRKDRRKRYLDRRKRE